MNLAPRPTVLFVDDEERILRSLSVLFRPRCDVLATTDPQEALRLLERHTVHVLVSDQRMPAMLGAELLGHAREISPHTVRILLTGYSDLEAAVEAVNAGEIWRYVNKPWTVESIQNTVRDAAAVASAQRAMAAGAPPTGHVEADAEILVIDTDPATALQVREQLSGNRRVHVVSNLTQAVEALSRHPVGVLVTEIMVGGDDMTHLLRTLKQRYPHVISIVATSMHDTPRLVRLINQTQVFRYLPKPLRPGMLARALESALARHDELRASVNLLPASLLVEEAASEVERTLSRRIGDYLSRLRARATVAGA